MQTTFTFAEVLGEYTVVELRDMARDIRLSGYSKMKKDELIDLIKGVVLDRDLMILKYLVASDREMELLEEAMKTKVVVDKNVMGYRYWLEVLVAFISKKHQIIVPLEIQEAFASFKADKALMEDRKLNAVIDQYALSCTNLYSIIDMKKFLEIINKQTEMKITEQDVTDWCQVRESGRGESQYFLADGYLMQDIYGTNPYADPVDYHVMLTEQEGKDYFVPAKEELLNYADDQYIEESPEFKELFAFLQKNTQMTPEASYDLCAEVQLLIRDGASEKEILEECVHMGLDIGRQKDVYKFMDRFDRMKFTARMPEHRGHSNAELAAKAPAGENGVKVMPFPARGHQPKVYPNDPCPCGSGKKYKKCCTRK